MANDEKFNSLSNIKLIFTTINNIKIMSKLYTFVIRITVHLCYQIFLLYILIFIALNYSFIILIIQSI